MWLSESNHSISECTSGEAVPHPPGQGGTVQGPQSHPPPVCLGCSGAGWTATGMALTNWQGSDPDPTRCPRYISTAAWRCAPPTLLGGGGLKAPIPPPPAALRVSLPSSAMTPLQTSQSWDQMQKALAGTSRKSHHGGSALQWDTPTPGTRCTAINQPLQNTSPRPSPCSHCMTRLHDQVA